MSPSGFARSSVLAALLVAVAVHPARAQPGPRPEATPANENTIGPGIHDKGGVYFEEERKQIAESIADLYKRYRCYVLIETCEIVPDGAGGIDLMDSAAVDHALGVWRDHLVPQADKRNTVFSWVMVQSKSGHRSSYWMGYGIFSKEEGDEINHEMLHQMRSGMPNALSYLGRVVARKQARVAKDSTAAIGQQESKRDNTNELRDAKAKEAMMTFRQTVLDGGLAGSDLDAVEVARGSVSYEALTDFAKDQIKEGRKGKDLKDDLLTFVKYFKDKK